MSKDDLKSKLKDLIYKSTIPKAKIFKSVCQDCPLKEKRFVPFRGNVNSKIFILGEAPGKDEEAELRPFVGRAGQFLSSILERVGLDEATDLFITNSVHCRPPNNQIKLVPEACSKCSSYWLQELQEVRPEVIITLGQTATDAVFTQCESPPKKLGRISDVQGKEYKIKIRGNRYILIPSYHPSYLMRNPKNRRPIVETIKNFKLAYQITGGTPESIAHESIYEQVTDSNFEDVKKYFLKKIKEGEPLCIDIETAHRGIVDNELLCIGLSAEDGLVYIFPVMGYERQLFLDEEKVKTLFLELFKMPEITWIAHNSVFDFGVLGILWGAIPEGEIDDTMWMYQLVDETAPKDAKTLMSIYTDVPDGYEDEIKRIVKRRKDNFLGIPNGKLWEYCKFDVVGERLMFYPIQKELEDKNLLDLYETIVKPINKLLIESSVRGIPVDRAKLKATEKSYWLKMRSTKHEAFLASKQREDFNMGSAPQLRKVLFEELKLKPIKRTSTGEPSTDAETLLRLKDQHEFPAKLLEYRSLSKLHSTYLTGILEKLDSNSFVHPTFKTAGAKTGRVTSEKPGLTNMPRGDLIKSHFVAPPGFKFIYGDYKQCEYMILAAYSGDPVLNEELNSGLDIHETATITMYGEELYFKAKNKPGTLTEKDYLLLPETSPLRSVDKKSLAKEMRATGKTFNFGLVYGGSASFIADTLSIPVQLVEEFLSRYFQKYQKMKDYHEIVPNFAQSKRQLANPFGRLKRFPGQWTKHAHNQALNFIPQSSTQEIVSRACIGIRQKFKEEDINGYLANMVYDMFLWLVEEDEKFERAMDIVEKVSMEPVPELNDLQIRVDIGVGQSWAEAEAASG